MLLVQRAVAWLDWLSVRLLTSKSKVVPPLKSIAQGFRLQPHGVTVQQARAHLCDPFGADCVMFSDSSCAGVFTSLESTCLVSWSCLIHRVLVVSP